MTPSHRKSLPLRPLTAALLTASLLGAGGQALADDDPIKVGILHSLSGTMAISETVLKDTVEMLIAKQNEQGGAARPPARGGGGGPGLQLAAVRRARPGAARPA